jgi:hypothetical protein
MRFIHSDNREPNQSEDYSEARIKRLLLDARNASMLGHRLAMLNIEGQHRLAQYRSHYNPNQPRVPAGHPDGGQWTSEGGGAAHVSAPSTSEQPTPAWLDLLTKGVNGDPAAPNVQQVALQVDMSDAMTGISTIDDTTKALTEILVRTFETMEWVGLSPARFGTALHVAFALQVRFAGLPGIGLGDVETTFSLEPNARYGSKGSIRTDVILRNAAGEIIAIYDVKTGNADLSERRVNEILRKTRAAPGTPVIQLHLTRGPSRKAEETGNDLARRYASLQLNMRRI